MPGLVDPIVEVLVSNLPSRVLDVASEHLKGFVAGSLGPDQDWVGICLAPTARYLHDPGYQRGGAPAYVELRVVGTDAAQEPCGYILVSLTEEDYPVPEFATRGGTKTDLVTEGVAGGTVNKFMRFGPCYVVAEDATGRELNEWGTPPLKATGPLPSGGVVEASGDTFETVAPPSRSTFDAVAAENYADLKEDCQSNPVRIEARARRSLDTAAAWRLATGILNPPLPLHVGETLDFLVDKSLTAAREVALNEQEIVRILDMPKGGFRATGVSQGSVLVRVEEQNGAVDFYTLTVKAALSASPGKEIPLDEKVTIKKLTWTAGTGWDGDERQYNQIKNKAWCPLDGCGPTAMAMLMGWWDVNGVPSAFYRLKEGVGDPLQFTFIYESLRDSDAPKNTKSAANAAVVVPIFDDFHKLGQTKCWLTSQLGTTYPDRMVSAFQEYVHRIAGHLTWPNNEFGDRFVRCKYYAAYFDAPGAGTDWDHSGIHLAKGIQNGVPGVTGIGLLAWDLHYPLAFGYRIVESISDGEVVDTNHYFQCNMGHGPGEKPQYHNASDVWFGLTAQFWQETYPVSSNDTIAATFTAPDRVDVFTRASLRQFQRSSNNQADQADWVGQWTNLPTGKFLSGPAACVSRRTSAHDDAAQSLFVFGLGDDYRVWQGQSPDDGASWNLAWAAIGEQQFTSSPAACMSADGQTIHVFARGEDTHIWRIRSQDGGSSWDDDWAVIGAEPFTSSPAACVSSDGLSLSVFAQGSDNQIWRAHSPDGGVNWDVDWKAIAEGAFDSSPAACVSSDGKSLHVFARTKHGRILRIHSSDGGGIWDNEWFQVAEGSFISSPAATCSADGKDVHLFAVGKDLLVNHLCSVHSGRSWPKKWTVIGDGTKVY
jgi:hypothetical protein